MARWERLRETDWSDQRESLNARTASGGTAAPLANGAPSADELEMQAAASEDDGPALNEYDESSDDAVTRIYDGEDIEKDGSAQPQAWGWRPASCVTRKRRARRRSRSASSRTAPASAPLTAAGTKRPRRLR